ncbi:hypothetical protein HUU59_07195 [bacterium]|nr:hypothetical protein [bacterium]
MVAFFVYSIITLGLLSAALLHPATPEWVWEFSFLVNIAILGLMSLLSFLAFRREQHYRHVFFALWLVFAFNALGAPFMTMFHIAGDFDNYLRYYVWYPIIGIHTLFAWAVTTITAGYIAPPRKRLLHVAIAGLALFIVVGWLYSPYIWDPLKAVATAADGSQSVSYDEINRSSAILNVYSLLVLLAFYVHKYKTDRPIGAYADTLLFLFGIALAIDTAEMLLPSAEMELLVVSQWAMMFTNIAMTVCLALRLKFKSQTIADYYESQCISDDPSIDRRIGRFDRLILRTFFDTEKVGKKIFLGTGSARMKVRRTPTHVARRASS